MLVSCCFPFLSVTWFSRNIAFPPLFKIVKVAAFGSHAAPLLFGVVRVQVFVMFFFFELFIQEYGRGWEAQVNVYLEVVSSLRNR